MLLSDHTQPGKCPQRRVSYLSGVGNVVGGGENGVNELSAEEAGVEGTGSSKSIGTSSIEIGDDSRNSEALMVIVNIKT